METNFIEVIVEKYKYIFPNMSVYIIDIEMSMTSTPSTVSNPPVSLLSSSANSTTMSLTTVISSSSSSSCK